MGALSLPPPYKGQNTQVPLAVLQSPYCQRMENFNTLGGVFKVRQGNDLFANQSAANSQIIDLASYPAATPLLLALTVDTSANQWRWYDVTGGAFGAAALTVAGTSFNVVSTFYFNSYLFWCLGADGMRYYNGTAWGAAGYTFSVGFQPYGGTGFKNRAYIIKKGSATYAYSAIAAITGATTDVDLGTVITQKSELYMIRPLTMTESVNSEAVLAFIFSSGEILIYSGSYPDSENWTLISRFQVARPLFVNSYVEAKGDTFIFTESGILSLRNLFMLGYSEELKTGFGVPVKNRWTQIIKAYRAVGIITDYIEGVYDQVNDRIIISLPRYVDPDTGVRVSNTIAQLIYDFNFGCWYEYLATDATINVGATACFHNGETYIGVGDATFSGGKIIKLEGATNFLDDQIDGSGTNAIDYTLITAPLPLPKFGVTEITGVEAIVKSDLYPQTSYKFIADLGRQSSDGQTIPTQGTDVANPMLNVGIQGARYSQLQISGSTISASIGLELYALNVWNDQGPQGSR